MRIYLALLFMIFGLTAFAQTNTSEHRWKPLVINEKEKIWYDAALADSITGDKFNMWILQMHKPPLKFDNIKGEILRTKTLYTINLTTVKYGILQAVYYDITNKELENFTYDTERYPENVKYSYPILEKSFLYTLIKELFKKPGVTNN